MKILGMEVMHERYTKSFLPGRPVLLIRPGSCGKICKLPVKPSAEAEVNFLRICQD